MIVRDEVTALQERVLGITREVQQLESEFESAVLRRSAAIDDAGRSAAVRDAAIASGKLREARQRLSDTKHALARLQGDEYER
jgi:hypothetical protein